MRIQAFIRAKYDKLSHQQKNMLLLCSSIICLLLIIEGCKSISHKTIMPEPTIIRKGDQIIIPEHSPLRSQIVIKRAVAATYPHRVSFPGIIEADPKFTVNVLPPLTGRLIALKTGLGKFVKKNQVLAIISAPDLAQAYANNDKARSTLHFAQLTLKRATASFKIGAISLKELELVKTNFVQARADFKQTTARLITLGHNKFSQLSIRAPLSGQITALNYGKGSYINDQTLPLFTISNIQSVWVTAQIPENLIGAVSTGQNADITLLAFPKETLHRQVNFINSLLEPDTRRNKTRIVLKNPLNKFQPNMFATVKIAVKEPNQVMIPISAILMNNDTISVYVETAPWIFEKREVQLGSEYDEQVRVKSGLKIGDRIVACGGVFIND